MGKVLTICGIDPGLRGGLVLLDQSGRPLDGRAMPVCAGHTGKSFVDGPVLAALLRRWAPGAVWLEDVYSMPDDGHVGAFTFGDGKGTIKGVCWGLGLDLRFVHPSVWKRDLRCTADKAQTRRRCHELLGPRAPAGAFTRRGVLSTEGKAEAGLIALYGLLRRGRS